MNDYAISLTIFKGKVFRFLHFNYIVDSLFRDNPSRPVGYQGPAFSNRNNPLLETQVYFRLYTLYRDTQVYTGVLYMTYLECKLSFQKQNLYTFMTHLKYSMALPNMANIFLVLKLLSQS